jgi:hypothetical protein
MFFPASKNKFVRLQQVAATTNGSAPQLEQGEKGSTHFLQLEHKTAL